MHREPDSEREREREPVSSFSHWRYAKNILYWFVWREYVSIRHEADLPVCFSAQLLSAGIPS